VASGDGSYNKADADEDAGDKVGHTLVTYALPAALVLAGIAALSMVLGTFSKTTTAAGGCDGRRRGHA